MAELVYDPGKLSNWRSYGRYRLRPRQNVCAIAGHRTWKMNGASTALFRLAEGLQSKAVAPPGLLNNFDGTAAVSTSPPT